MQQNMIYCTYKIQEDAMSTAIRLPAGLIEEAKMHSSISFRTLSKQIEYWASLGKIADQNSDLPVSFIKGCIEAKTELESGKISNFEFIDK